MSKTDESSLKAKHPYLKRMIKDIQEKDTSVQIVGKITEKISNKEFKLSDDSGEISIIVSPSTQPSDVTPRINMIVKVFGEFANAKKNVLNVKIIADYSDLNFESYKKSYKLARKYLPQS